jgi:O-antigen/teichoic acid export membrane protein
MVAFGGHLTGASLCQYLNRNLDNVLIGKVWGEGSLGLYNRAYSLLLMPITQLNGPITNVALPALSRLQNDPARYRAYYRKALGLLATVGMPLVVFTGVDALRIVRFLLGEHWLGTVPIFQALAPAAFIGTFNVATGWLYVSLGRTARQLRWAILQTPVIVAGFFLGLPYGPVGVAAAYSAVTVLLRGPAFAYCLKGTFVRSSDIVGALLPAAVGSLVAGAGILALQAFGPPQLASAGDFPAIAADAVLYAVLYGLAYWLVPGGRANLKVIVDAARKLIQPAIRAEDMPSAPAGK